MPNKYDHNLIWSKSTTKYKNVCTFQYLVLSKLSLKAYQSHCHNSCIEHNRTLMLESQPWEKHTHSQDSLDLPAQHKWTVEIRRGGAQEEMLRFRVPAWIDSTNLKEFHCGWGSHHQYSTCGTLDDLLNPMLLHFLQLSNGASSERYVHCMSNMHTWHMVGGPIML